MEKILWEGKRCLKSFYDMILCGALLIIVRCLTLLLKIPGIEYFVLFGMLAGASLFLLALFLSLSYRYVITEDLLRKEYCFFASSREEVPLESVTNIVVYQDVIGRALDFGTVRADTAGTPYMGISFVGVKDPYECANLVRRVVRNARKKHDSDMYGERRKQNAVDETESERPPRII